MIGYVLTTLLHILFLGATSTEQVLERFKNQRDTRKRLEYLRRTSEVEKRQLETQQNKLLAEIEERKYAQEHDKDKYVKLLVN